MYLNSVNKTVNITFINNQINNYNEENKLINNIKSKINKENYNENELQNLNFDVYYHSPLKSSKDKLLDLLDKYNKPNVNIKEDILISERKYGIFENLTMNQIREKYPELYKEWITNDNINGEGIESIENLIDRIKLFISKIISFDYYNILVVTHTDFLYALFKYVTNYNLKEKAKNLNFYIEDNSIVNLKINIIFDKMILFLNINGQEYRKMIDF